ncbi:MAG: isoprenylcysteine carboxylmethyltransferase family protein [Burkholderiaceae bacterium]|nr:isoprenylcysteine carboxylmethyltransferase family protein [Burkholderiaceae bacterium]
MAVIAGLAAPFFLQRQAPLFAWAIGLGAAALGLWALSANRPGNFNIRPLPKAGGRLVQAGPYRWIRHPMYTSILLAALAGLYGVDLPHRPAVGTAFFALAAVLWFKAGIEERWMAAQHPAYADYVRTTRRFVPWLL